MKMQRKHVYVKCSYGFQWQSILMFLKFVLVGKCFMKIPGFKLFSIIYMSRIGFLYLGAKEKAAVGYWKGQGSVNCTGGSTRQIPEKEDELCSGN